MRRKRPPATQPAPAPGLHVAAALTVTWSAGAALAPAAGIWVGIGGTALLLAALLLVLDRDRLLPLFVPTRRGLAWGVGGALLMVAATYGLYPLAVQFLPGLAHEVGRLYGLFGSPGPLVLGLLLPLIIVSEEIVWRGAVQNTLEGRLPGALPALAAGLLYGLAHLPAGSWLLALVAAAAGTFWGLLRRHSGGLLAPLIAHLVWDALVMVALPLSAGPR